jgi:hypothetical protein
MHLDRVAHHVADLLADVLAILDGRAGAWGLDVEVVTDLAGWRVDEHRVAATALHEPSAPLMKEVTLGIRAARGATDEPGVGPGTRDRLRGVEFEPACYLISWLNGHCRLRGHDHYRPSIGSDGADDASPAAGVWEEDTRDGGG